jgi:ubiquinone/menaquinone biosynthesis C-methylase UbiE
VDLQVVCPRCKGALAEDDGLRCTACEVSYPVLDGVPLLVGAELTNQHQQQRQYFDASFSGYEQYTVENWRLSYLLRIYEELAVLDSGSPYLDVGVGGSGATVIEAAKRGVPAAGCDLSVEGVLTARRFAETEGVVDRSRFVVCTAEALPFADRTFGAVSAVALLEHVDNDQAVVAEIARVATPEARVFLMVPHAFRFMPPPAWPFYWWHDRRIGHKRHYDEAQLVRLCAEVGLEHVSTSYTAHPVKLLQAAAAIVMPRLRERNSRTWWRLEALDRRAGGRRLGALHMSAVFRRLP